MATAAFPAVTAEHDLDLDVDLRARNRPWVLAVAFVGVLFGAGLAMLGTTFDVKTLWAAAVVVWLPCVAAVAHVARDVQADRAAARDI